MWDKADEISGKILYTIICIVVGFGFFGGVILAGNLIQAIVENPVPTAIIGVILFVFYLVGRYLIKKVFG